VGAASDALTAWVHDAARAEGYREVRVGIRRQLLANMTFYLRLGYQIVAEHRHPGYADVTWIELARSV